MLLKWAIPVPVLAKPRKHGHEMAAMDKDVVNRLNEVKGRMASALRAAGRSPEKAELIAVSKTFSAEDIEPAILAGQRKFGENRVQESLSKWPDLKRQHPDLELHLIGPLQSNKVDDAVRLFDVIQTVDRPKIAAAIAKACRDQGRELHCLVQVNIGSEPQKAGVGPKDVDPFIRACIQQFGLKIVGVMCIPPQGENPVTYFEQMKDIAIRNGLKEISMGMSSDYELALAHGATLVRVGSAIFGTR